MIFGVVFSTNARNKRIENDLQMIKEKLGIVQENRDFNLSDEEIEEELERDALLERESNETGRINTTNELNEQIEKELEEYLELDDKDKDRNK
ncbi:hypothetical protein [Paenibacillus beijingensis]|uniref:hypothetical protein n=1 Tax=Paenibacillus beijingensis TaxID=1126833 RepID=UPI0011DD0E85|nr:hypothetical protein [Paenibacillus beijingensis]